MSISRNAQTRRRNPILVVRNWSLMSVIFIVFLVLKLAEVGKVADWSWWWVTAPYWGPIVLWLAIFLILGVGWVLVSLWIVVSERIKAKKGNDSE